MKKNRYVVQVVLFLTVLLILCVISALTYSNAFAEAVVGAKGGDIVVVEPSASAPEPAWGTASSATYTVHATEFVPPSSTVTWATSNLGVISVYQTSTTTTDWWAPVHLPQGARITAVEFEICDTTATGQILFGMARMVAPGSSGANITNVGSTGTAATPGCALFPLTLFTPRTVDNKNEAYLFFVDWQGTFANTNRFVAARVTYNLQVSPAPSTATFTDVPTSHPFFPYVEALAAAGITGGCGGGNYCPDSSVTRGQMAVFLSRALGLHWPN